MSCLDGIPFLYQGDELGLVDGVIAEEHQADPIALRNPGTTDGRDASRTPMPWDDGPGNGFTTAAEAWLPSLPRRREETVEYQRVTMGTPLQHFRSLVGLRRNTAIWSKPIVSLERDHLVTRIARPGAYVVANLGLDAAPLQLPAGDWRVAFQSWPIPAPEHGETASIPQFAPAESTIVFLDQSGA